jgi:hypothetical protein
MFAKKKQPFIKTAQLSTLIAAEITAISVCGGCASTASREHVTGE